ncbi:TP53-binding protein 1-like [Watersipora subatra]|uniref:TP53-binding protein 1-like n=1 Tax=Watersipora subatra TaxID=2589382 RepID=UPI00355C8611
MNTSQPIDTQDCVSNESPTTESEATTQLPLAQGDILDGSRPAASPSVFVQLRTSPRKIQRIEPTSSVSDQDSKGLDLIAVEDAHSQNLFDTQTQESSQAAEVKQQEDEDMIAPRMRKARPCIESQDDAVEQKSNSCEEPASGASKLKEKVLPDGRIIKYAHTDVVRRYYDASGRLVHTEAEEVDSTQGSSGYLADHSSSGTSSGVSHNSQELSLKAHRSAEDALFVSPKVPVLRSVKSIPLSSETAKSTSLAPLPTNHAVVLTAQQRRNILSAITGNKPQPEPKEKAAAEFSPLSNFDTSPPNPTNLSAISSIMADSQNADTEPPSQSDSCGGTAKAQSKVMADHVSGESTAEVAIAEEKNVDLNRHAEAGGRKATTTVRLIKRRKRSRSSSSKQVSFQQTDLPTTRHANKRARKPSSSNESSSSAVPYGRCARNLPAPSHKELVVGARVVAKWPSDNYYYMGMVAQKDRGMWLVIYDDGNNCRVSSKDLLVIKCIPKRHAVLARRPGSEEYVPAIVVSNEDEYYDVSLINETSPGLIRVAAKDICLDSGQFINLTTLLASQGSSTEGESVENARATVILTKPLSSTPVLLTRTAAQSAKTAKIFTDVQRSPIKSRSSHSGEPAAGVVALKFGETATTSLDIFSGFVFMVTSLSKNKLVNEVMDRLGIADEDSQSQSQVDSADEKDDAVNLETLCAKIEALGGMVIDQFDADAVAAAKRSYLISSGFRRTVKYLQCLAANIAPVSYSWVDHCFAHKELIPERCYLLPAGVNRDGNVVEWGSLRSTNKPTPLKGVSILLSTKNVRSTFVEDWTSILKVAGALVIKKISITLGVKPDYIMTNADGCSKTHLNQASRLNIPVVDTEWAIQLLINGTQT